MRIMSISDAPPRVPTERSLQATLARASKPVNLSTRQVDCRRAHEDTLDIRRPGQHPRLISPIITSWSRWVLPTRCASMSAGGARVCIDKHRQTTHCQTSSQINGRGRLADAALLVGDCNDTRGRGLAILGVCEHTQIGDVAFDLRGQRGVSYRDTFLATASSLRATARRSSASSPRCMNTHRNHDALHHTPKK